MRISIAFCFLLFLTTTLLAQTPKTGSISGTVRDDSTQRPLEFVNVLLLKTADSTLITGVVTDDNGKFRIENIPFGTYAIKFGFIGYQDKIVEPIKIDSLKRRLNLKPISLLVSDIHMQEVSVTAEAPVFNHSIDRKVYNIDQDIMSKAGSASEVLENIPSVQVDINGVVSLRGSSSVLIMIDGKSSPLLDKKGGMFLEQLPASAIEKVEVITNPSAKYKSKGKAGIINIVMKKNTSLGMHGNVSANVGTGDRYNGQIRLNYNPKGINLYGNYSFRRNNSDHTNFDSRVEYPTTDPAALPSSYYTDSLFSLSAPLTNIVTLGVDYHCDDLNTAGASGNYLNTYFQRIDTSHRNLENSGHTVISNYDRNANGHEDEKQYSASAYVLHKFAKRGHSLRLNASVSGNPDREEYKFTNVYTVPALPSTYDNSIINDRDNRSQWTLDYSYTMSKNTIVEAGYAGEFNTAALNYYAEYFDFRTQGFVVDSARTSDFTTNDLSNALYATYKHSFGKFGLGMGLRGEGVTTRSELLTLDSVVTTKYANAYPSLHLSYKINTTDELQLSYSKRTVRPRGRELDPFPEYRDPRNVSKGDPYLLPEYVHSFECGLQLQGEYVSFLPTLFYRYSLNNITSIKELVNRSTLLTTKKNIANNQSLGLELIISLFGGDVVHADLSTTGFYEQIDASNVPGGEVKSALSWSGTLKASVSITSSTRFQINSHANSSRLTAQGEYAPNAVVNVGIRQDLFDNSLSLMFSLSDVFNSYKRDYTLDIPRLHQEVVYTRDSRYAFFGVVFRIGGTARKTSDEGEGADDEL